MNNLKALKGNIIFTSTFGKYDILEHGYIVIKDGKVLETCKSISDKFDGIEIEDYGDKIIIPGFVDLHLHAPQFVNRGLGLDKELLDWLTTYTFPEEAKYNNLSYAKKAYEKFVYELWKFGTTRSVIFSTIHNEATTLLMDILNKVGLGALVGKVNMDRNCPDFYIEDTQKSLDDTKKFIEDTKGKYKNIEPIITPRFVPTCTPELMKGLGELAREYDIKVQSHLSENRGEVEWVKELHPDLKNYASVYDHYGLFGNDIPTVMAHCVWNDQDEMDLMSKNKVFVAHSPFSNTNLSSGIAPVRQFLENNVPVGLASDISGGHSISIASVISQAAQLSKMRWVYVNDKYAPLNTPELLYLGTKGGGEFFGKVGSFEPDYEFDALVIDDSSLSDVNERSLEERIERYLYIGDDRNIVERYVSGVKLKKPNF